MAGSLFNIKPVNEHAAAQPEILFIINPNAGRRDAIKLLRKLEHYRSLVDIRITERPGHCAEIVLSEFNNYKVFVAAGGDGTVNEVASTLVGTNKKLAIYPSGSGNGFAREFGFDKNLGRLVNAIQHGQVLKADLIDINGNPTFHLSGVGFDSAVAHQFVHHKRRGFWNYFISAIEALLSFRPIEATITCENETIAGRFFMINITNNRQFGYNAVIVPTANPTDGKFDLVLVPPFPLYLFPVFAFKLLAGILEPEKDFRVISCEKEATLVTTETKIHIDGEPRIFQSPLKIKLRPGVLNVIDTGRTKFKENTLDEASNKKSFPQQLHYIFML
jgi:YegS/Rv2252/BmrU family lipid kinase